MNATENSDQVPAHDFAHFGVDHLAYIRPVEIDGTPAFAIHAADGATIGVMRERLVAEAAARQFDLEPLSLH